MTTSSDLLKESFGDETIVALSTPMGKSALAVIRLSGSDAFKTVATYFFKRRSDGELYQTNIENANRHFGLIIDDKRVIDEVVISLYKAPHSYTGEDVVELTCHCNPFIIKEILNLLLRNTRLAKPGEFTQRAFFNNKMDLTKAEAVGDLLNATTLRSHKAAISQLEGSLYNKISSLLSELTRYRAELELEIDFVEQDLPELDLNELKAGLKRLYHNLTELLTTGQEGLVLREGLAVVLVGEPNVGKSSLFNVLLETNRAIVHQTPGTTRDYLEESLSIDGYLIKLYDTAGLREAQDEVELDGIARTELLLNNAHRIICVEDGRELVDNYKDIVFEEHSSKLIKVLNKSDILDKETLESYRKQGYLICSAVTGEGVEALKQKVVEFFHIDPETLDSGVLTNVRHINAVQRSKDKLETALQSIAMGLGYEFIAFDLKESSEALEEVVGRITSDDILNQIFEDFCIGK